MKTIRQTILEKGKNITNIYFTAGHPTLNSVEEIIISLASSGVDLIELGMPYSDPLADGPTIQNSSAVALKNGQTIGNIFHQVAQVRRKTSIPIMLMGYYNQLLQYGIDRFLHDSHQSAIQGLIIPDLPMDIYEQQYEEKFKKHEIEISFLVTPMTSHQRIQQADRLSSSFLYVVSQSSITGKSGDFSDEQLLYFKQIKEMKLASPSLLGFGIHNAETRKIANQYFNGSIIGSAFIRAIDQASDADLSTRIKQFIESI